MTGGKALSKGDLWEEYSTNLHAAYSALRHAFRRSGLTQDELADLLGADKGLTSKRLHGKANLTLKTLSFIASALKCRLQIYFVPYDEVKAVEQRGTAIIASLVQPASTLNDATDGLAEPSTVRWAAAA